MRGSEGTPRSATRLFLVYAAVSAVPVLILGLVLARAYHVEADRRGLDEAKAQSAIVASTAVEPLLDGTDLRRGLDPATEAALRKVADTAVASGAVTRLRTHECFGSCDRAPMCLVNYQYREHLQGEARAKLVADLRALAATS